jgi:hypothetical protein
MCAPSYAPPPPLRNDFSNARKRNLDAWTQWRTERNAAAIDCLFGRNEATLENIPTLEKAIRNHASYRDDPTAIASTLMSYSANMHSQSTLSRSNFYNFGIPRPKIDPDTMRTRIKTEMSKHGQEIGADSLGTSRTWPMDPLAFRERYIPNDVVSKLVKPSNKTKSEGDKPPKSILVPPKPKKEKSKKAKSAQAKSQPSPTLMQTPNPSRRNSVKFDLNL